MRGHGEGKDEWKQHYGKNSSYNSNRRRETGIERVMKTTAKDDNDTGGAVTCVDEDWTRKGTKNEW